MDDNVSKFQMLAAHISAQYDQRGTDGILAGPEPLYFILGILHERSKQPAVDGHQLIDEIFEQMSLNFSVGFDFDAFYERMKASAAPIPNPHDTKGSTSDRTPEPSLVYETTSPALDLPTTD